jgi:uncharacterized protein (TIGR02246 family)
MSSPGGTILCLWFEKTAESLMHRRNLLIVALAIFGSIASPPAAVSAADEARKQDEQAIRAAARQYIEALARGDTKAMLAQWVPDGDIVDEFGRSTPARDVVEQEAQARRTSADENPGARAELTSSSIRFLTSDVAIEDGTVEVSPKGLPAARGRFAAIWVKHEGKWKLASLREMRAPTATADDLAALDWMLGDWSGTLDKARFDVSARWNEKHTFLVRDLTLTRDGKVILKGGQRIGVDPLDGKIKSWMHDSEGGHGEGLWTRHGDTWVVQATGVTPDGRRTSATNVYAYDGNNHMTWKSTGGFSNGQSVPDFEVTLERAAASEK